MVLPPQLACPAHLETLACGTVNNNELLCRHGCRFPILLDIPRFVNSSTYADGFGLQWKRFQKTQLDSHTGTTISSDRLRRCLGEDLEGVNGRSILEVGCGAGRFTEILLRAGGRVFACDLSNAVEANHANCAHWPGYFVCQADILHLPVLPNSFDVVLSLGVIQHTVNPEVTISTLTRYLRPGGKLVLDHYSYDYNYNLARQVLRSLLLRLSPESSMKAATALGRILLPLHKLCWRNQRPFGRARRYLAKVSPLIDYFDSYPELGTKLLQDWAILDTHDTLTDRYKHFRSAEEIRSSLQGCGLIDIEVVLGGNGIEARARKPSG